MGDVNYVMFVKIVSTCLAGWKCKHRNTSKSVPIRPVLRYDIYISLFSVSKCFMSCDTLLSKPSY